MGRYGLIGAKLSHSYSKPIHEMLGNPAYEYFELTPEGLREFMLAKDFCAVNVTIPYKIDVMEYCDFISDEAQEIGCVNTIVNRNGVLYGYNTDAYGLEYVARRAGIALKDKKIIILGSGGTSRTAKAVAKKCGCASLAVISRTGEDNYTNLDRHADAEVLINTTPVGMYPNMDCAAVSLDIFPRLEGVIDVIYNPSQTDLLFDARDRGIPYSNGLWMLVAQAKRAHELFFDTVVDDGIIEDITERLALGMKSIVLVGMPGAGKSTLGRLIAKELGLDFVDTDEIVAQMAGMSIPELIASKGEAHFRDVEAAAVRHAAHLPPCVIATGGGAIIRRENRRLLGRNATVILLDRPDESLATEGRPLSKDVETVRRLREQRRGFYEAVKDVRIEVDADCALTLQRALKILKK